MMKTTNNPPSAERWVYQRQLLISEIGLQIVYGYCTIPLLTSEIKGAL